MQWLKGRRAHHLLAEFPHLKKQFWGRRLWARGHFCRSSGNVTDEVIAKYIADQNVNQDEDFKVDGGVHLLPEARLVRETFCRPLAGTGHLTIASIGDDADKIDYEIYFRARRSRA
jgi:hypothetical protein